MDILTKLALLNTGNSQKKLIEGGKEQFSQEIKQLDLNSLKNNINTNNILEPLIVKDKKLSTSSSISTERERVTI